MKFILDISEINKESWDSVSHAPFYKSCDLKIPLVSGMFQKDLDIDLNELSKEQRKQYNKCRKIAYEMFPDKNKEWPTGIDLSQLPEKSKLIVVKK